MSMLLTGQNGTEFELGLIENQLEDTQDDYADDTALTISFRVATPDDEWEETSPCLNLFELTNLAEWLDGLTTDHPEVPELELVEPNLSFSIVGDKGKTVTIRIGFHLSDRPEEAGVDADTKADHVDIKLDREQVQAASAQLRSDLHDLNLADHETLTAEQELGQVLATEEDPDLAPQDSEDPLEDQPGER